MNFVIEKSEKASRILDDEELVQLVFWGGVKIE